MNEAMRDALLDGVLVSLYGANTTELQRILKILKVDTGEVLRKAIMQNLDKASDFDLVLISAKLN